MSDRDERLGALRAQGYASDTELRRAADTTPPPARRVPPGPQLPRHAELHCLSAFSFLRGASEPQELVERAVTLGYEALALTDECSLAGVVRAHKQLREMREAAHHDLQQAAREAGEPEDAIAAIAQPPLLQLLIGSEFLVRDDAGTPRFKLVLLAQNLCGYGNLSQFITQLRRASPVKGEYTLHLRQIASERLADCLALLVLPREAPDAELLPAAQWALQHFTGRAWLAVELLREAGDAAWLTRLQALSDATALPLVAAGDVHFHVRSRKALQDVMTATRLGRPVADCGFDLQPNAERHLRSRYRLSRLYPPELMAETLHVAARCSFSLNEIRYQYPSEVVPAGVTPRQHLRALTYAGAEKRWPWSQGGVPDKWKHRIEHELELIEDLGYEHYFLTVADIVAFARSIHILCQGRGSAANSVVCYCLHVTSVDPDRSTLLFERFISRERNEPPDIDVDFEHERREEVIQYLYKKYGRDRAALTAVVICYRPKSAIRDVGKALGFSEAQLDVMSNDHSGWSTQVLPEEHRAALLQQLGMADDDPRLQQLITLARQLNGLPRHLSQHVGGFVLTEGPLERLVPIENATMENRSVIEWDKDDIDELKMMKVDVLALGMLTAIRKCFDLVNPLRGTAIDLTIPDNDTATYDMICKADTVGVFQIESRAQMSMLPRLQPRTYYDLVVEVAIVRPGPIEGGMVHPYLKNRALPEDQVEYPSEALKEALWRTRGVPIFQEQVMQVAMIAAGFSAGEADELRRAMAAWKRPGVLEKYYDKVVDGMRARGYTDDFAKRIFDQIKGFSSYGFPESHAASFALLTYVSSWLKCHEPAAFLCALLNSQPLGFYTPSQLVQDARRHHIEVRSIDVNHSDHDSTLEPREGQHLAHQGAGHGTAGIPGCEQPAVRLGLRLVSGLGDEAALRIERARRQGGLFARPQDLALRSRLSQHDMQQLAAADALTSLAGHRRQQVWQASALHAMPALLQGSLLPEDDLELPSAPEGEEVLWDYAATGLTLRRHPLALLRPRLARDGWLSARQLEDVKSGRRARACGIVTGRQKPQTAKGTLFVTLEDETGNVQVIVWPQVYEEHRNTILGARLLAVEGVWQRGDGDVRHLLARGFKNLNPWLGRLPTESRDFR
ncbi:error-prone DNA polymerase [Roseateles cellulosilyticus]|uniref:Error-prone DNA polymerase n=1 Tax=Pelomonas cellulosilytica TaxID=2906762 RepID=A0ABS8XY93_9BURK|nr:error-prone DNA polymerase [Pelomonas sp. P8]MCE4556240.1 error-prone DNA polymerase [Pelomonas sp. P8]